MRGTDTHPDRSPSPDVANSRINLPSKRISKYLFIDVIVNVLGDYQIKPIALVDIVSTQNNQNKESITKMNFLCVFRQPKRICKTMLSSVC